MGFLILQLLPGLLYSGEKENFGDISTLLNPEIVDKIVKSS
jgi:hypothetical protein